MYYDSVTKLLLQRPLWLGGGWTCMIVFLFAEPYCFCYHEVCMASKRMRQVCDLPIGR